MTLYFYCRLIIAAKLERIANMSEFTEFKFCDEYHRPLPFHEPFESGDTIVPRYFYTYVDFEICRRP